MCKRRNERKRRQGRGKRGERNGRGELRLQTSNASKENYCILKSCDVSF